MPGSENDTLNRVNKQIARKNTWVPIKISLSAIGISLSSLSNTTKYTNAAGPRMIISVNVVNLRSLGDRHLDLELYVI